MELKEICSILEEIAPLSTAESFDNSGLLLELSCDTKKILLALDVTDEVVEEAISLGVDLIITHHPLIFSGIKNIRWENPLGNRIIRLIQNNISVYSCHTNLDKSSVGTNALLFDKFNLINKQVLIKGETLECALGLVGELEREIPLKEFLENTKRILSLEYLNYYTNNINIGVKRVGILTGSGCDYFYLDEAIKNNCQVYITGDVTFHKGQYALERGLSIIDGTHYGTEVIVLIRLKEILADKFKGEIYLSKTNGQIVKTI